MLRTSFCRGEGDEAKGQNNGRELHIHSNQMNEIKRDQVAKEEQETAVGGRGELMTVDQTGSEKEKRSSFPSKLQSE